MKKRYLILMAVLSFLLFLLGCGGSSEKELGKNELVRVNNTSITLEEFHQMSENQPLEGKLRLLTEKGQRDFLENYVITREVLHQEARKRGVDKDRRILSKVEDFKRAMVIDALLEEVLKGKDQVTESEIEQYYKENKNRFTEPREVKIRQIFVTSEPILKEVLKKLSSGERFEKLASTYNVGQFREDGGNLGYIRRGQLAPPFAPIEEAAFSLREKGEISEVIKTSYGFHILRLEDKIGTVLRPLSEVKEKIRFFLQTKKRQDAYLEYVKEVKSKAKIVINEKLWAEEGKKEQKSEEKKK